MLLKWDLFNRVRNSVYKSVTQDSQLDLTLSSSNPTLKHGNGAKQKSAKDAECGLSGRGVVSHVLQHGVSFPAVKCGIISGFRLRSRGNRV